MVDAAIAELHGLGPGREIYAKWFQNPVPPKGLNLNFPLSDDMKALYKSAERQGARLVLHGGLRSTRWPDRDARPASSDVPIRPPGARMDYSWNWGVFLSARVGWDHLPRTGCWPALRMTVVLSLASWVLALVPGP